MKEKQDVAMHISLLDYMASSALQALIETNHINQFNTKGLAESAYQIAAAMLKAREATND